MRRHRAEWRSFGAPGVLVPPLSPDKGGYVPFSKKTLAPDT